MTDGVYQLKNQVDRLTDLVRGLDRSVTLVGQQVTVVGEEQRETRGELSVLRSEFAEFREVHQRTAAKQLAETRVGVLQDKLAHEFGHHDVVRRSATGMLQAFDSGLVTEETVHRVSEELMVQTPRYWLAPVLVAMARWAGDDRDGCARAINEGFQRAPDKTSLFMALVLRRQRREAAAVRWLRHYLMAQDPAALGRAFAVILECISHGAFGPGGVEVMRERLESWRTQLLRDEEKLRAQVAGWRSYLDSHIALPAGHAFPRLAAVSPQWSQMEAVLARAEAHRSVLAKYTALMSAETEPLDRLEDAVDDILDLLVGDCDDEELPLRRELAYREAVIESEGDVTRAKQAVMSDGRTMETTLDYLTIQTRSALNPAAIGVSASTQRIAIAACHEWFAEAHASFTRDYRGRLPVEVQAVFGTAHNTGAETFQLPTWTGSFTKPIEGLERSLADHWDRHGQSYVDKLAFNWRRQAMIAGGVVAAALLVLALCAGIVPALIVAVIGGGIWATVLYSQNQSAVRRQQEIRLHLERGRAQSLTQLRAAGAELVDWTTRYREADGLESRVREMIAQLATAGQAPTPFERRAVTPADARGE